MKIQKRLIILVTFLFFLMVLAVVPASAGGFDLTGSWRCDDGGTYYVRQAGNEIWWYGESGDGGRSWSNVFYGYIQGNRIVGKWADVPHGQNQGLGEMTMEIQAINRLKAMRKTGGFGGSEWTR